MLKGVDVVIEHDDPRLWIALGRPFTFENRCGPA